VTRLQAGRGQVQVPAAGNDFSLLHNTQPAFYSESKNSPSAMNKLAEVRLATQLYIMSTKQIERQSKVHPVTCHEGTEREYIYSSTIHLTSMLDGNMWLTPHHGHFTPRKKTGHPLRMRLCDTWTGAENLAPNGMRSPFREN